MGIRPGRLPSPDQSRPRQSQHLGHDPERRPLADAEGAAAALTVRLLRRVLLALAALALCAAGAVAGVLWWSLPPSGLRAAVPGLSAPVQITLDDDGIPRIT